MKCFRFPRLLGDVGCQGTPVSSTKKGGERGLLGADVGDVLLFVLHILHIYIYIYVYIYVYIYMYRYSYLFFDFIFIYWFFPGCYDFTDSVELVSMREGVVYKGSTEKIAAEGL